jgi:uncharacterized membrane protein YcaP (DUF421 family)
MFFESWTSVGRVVLTTVLAYASLLVLLRASGKRTLSKLNAFDLVVTVALGSTLATVAVSRSVPLVDGVAAFATLVAAQYLVAWGSTRSAAIARAAKSDPRVVFYRGTFARGAMREERLTEGEILGAIRQASVGALEEVEAVVLETSGDLAVLRRPSQGARSRVLEGVSFEGAPSPVPADARG